MFVSAAAVLLPARAVAGLLQEVLLSTKAVAVRTHVSCV